MEETKYINVDNMATRLCQILKDARESMVDDENKDFIMENFSDEYLEDKSNEMAWRFNCDMKNIFIIWIIESVAILITLIMIIPTIFMGRLHTIPLL